MARDTIRDPYVSGYFVFRDGPLESQENTEF